jgi:pSer/pThr/pTyr-binding forkhead associated (FHA) protein
MARLVLVYPDEDKGQTFPLPPHPVVVGRSKDCAVQIGHESLSRRHARIHYTPDGWCFEDLQSTNGSFVNDVEVARAILRDADVLKVGVAILEFDENGAGGCWSGSDDDSGSSPAPAHAAVFKPSA